MAVFTYCMLRSGKLSCQRCGPGAGRKHCDRLVGSALVSLFPLSSALCAGQLCRVVPRIDSRAHVRRTKTIYPMDVTHGWTESCRQPHNTCALQGPPIPHRPPTNFSSGIVLVRDDDRPKSWQKPFSPKSGVGRNADGNRKRVILWAGGPQCFPAPKARNDRLKAADTPPTIKTYHCYLNGKIRRSGRIPAVWFLFMYIVCGK